MSLCSACGLQMDGESSLCLHHQAADGDWAKANLVWCDLIHRGVVPIRLPKRERDDDFWSSEEQPVQTAEAAAMWA